MQERRAKRALNAAPTESGEDIDEANLVAEENEPHEPDQDRNYADLHAETSWAKV